MSRYVAFDLEVCRWPEDKDTDWRLIRPLGISCIGLFGTGWDEPLVFYAGQNESRPQPRAMLKEELYVFLEHLIKLKNKGYQICGWNSLQFDFNVLGEEIGDVTTVSSYAMTHIDPMFQIFCTFGWPVSLNAVAQGLGLPLKLSTVPNGVGPKEESLGAAAPSMWMEGTDKDRQTILEYVGQDAIVTSNIVEVATRTRFLRWNSQKGRPYELAFDPPMTVAECMRLPEKDNSWMDNPIERKAFYDWMQ